MLRKLLYFGPNKKSIPYFNPPGYRSTRIYTCQKRPFSGYKLWAYILDFTVFTILLKHITKKYGPMCLYSGYNSSSKLITVLSHLHLSFGILFLLLLLWEILQTKHICNWYLLVLSLYLISYSSYAEFLFESLKFDVISYLFSSH